MTAAGLRVDEAVDLRAEMALLRGFIVERSHERIRYVLVRASGLFGKSTLLPFSDPRVDFGARAIDLDIDDRTLWQLRDFTPKQLLTT